MAARQLVAFHFPYLATPAHREGSTEPEVRECTVCLDQKPTLEFVQITENCPHERNVCSECAQQTLLSTLNGVNWNQLGCMSANCGQVLRHVDMRRVATDEIFEQYDDFATPSAVSALEQFRWCMRDGCKSGQEHLLGGGQVFECNACGHQQRVTHNRPWHDGESCHEFDLRTNPEARRQAKDQASEEKIWETTQQCPACRVNIEKNQGCSHMTCSKCSHEFCWLCLAPWNGETDTHIQGCRFSLDV